MYIFHADEMKINGLRKKPKLSDMKQYVIHRCFTIKIYFKLYISLKQHQYMSYMSKKTSKRQEEIITLTDENQRQIRMFQRQKKEMLEEYAKQKQSNFIFFKFYMSQ